MISVLIFSKTQEKTPRVDERDRASIARSSGSGARSNARAYQMRSQGSPRGGASINASGGALAC